jgi:protein-S-isoprenylcysteine O-methyltransferase Ste14
VNEDGRSDAADGVTGPRNQPSPLTVAGVWLLYGLHFGLTSYAAVESSWPLPVPAVLSFGGGLLLLLVGGAMNLAAAVSFRSLKRLSGRDTSRLITGGIYRWSRNPQNLGWTLFLVGLGLLRTSGLVLLLAALFWTGFRMYLPLEERLLERLFGDAYREYRSRTHRYFGPQKRP